MAASFIKGRTALWKKENLLVTSNFSFFHSVFERLVRQTHNNQGQFGTGLQDTSEPQPSTGETQERHE